jgi:hypothetical protein
MNRQTRTALFAVLALVNSAAIWGQTGWALDHIVPAHTDWRAALALSLGFAAALELTGVVLALLADAAEVNHTPAGGIRLGSYAMGLASGALNLSHWGWNAAGIAFAFLSALSPFLWGIRARVRRGAPAAPSRRFWHPLRSIVLIRYMAWEGIATEDEALSHWYSTPEALSPEEVEQAEERLSLLAEEQAEMDWSTAAEIELGTEMLAETPISPAPSAPAIERAPRGEISPALRSAVEALMNGDRPEVGGPGASAAVIGRYSKVLRTLRDNPNAQISATAEKVKPELVDILRSHAREAAPR